MLVEQKGTTSYVAGFAFRHNREGDHAHVLLIRKNRPEWQAGLLNGIGGHVDVDEDMCIHAMVREFREETGIETSVRDWQHFVGLALPYGFVYFYVASLDAARFDVFQKTTDEEPVSVCLDTPPVGTLANVPYLLSEASYWLPDDPCARWPQRTQPRAIPEEATHAS